MAASFPTSVKTFTAKTDGVDYPQAVHINDLQDEVNAIETNIGTTAAGGANLFKRINNLTVDSTPDRTADYLGTYDTSAATGKKILVQDAGGYVLMAYISNAAAGVAPADATTYTFTPLAGYGLASTMASHKLRIPRAGVIRRVYIDGICTVGSAETSTISLRLNDTTDTTITSTAAFNASPIAISNTAMSVTVSAGDYVNIKWVTPTWVTNPTALSMWALIWVC